MERKSHNLSCLILLVFIVLSGVGVVVSYPLWGKPGISFSAKKNGEEVALNIALHHATGLSHVSVYDKDAKETLWAVDLAYYPGPFLVYGKVPASFKDFNGNSQEAWQTFPLARQARPLPVGRELVIEILYSCDDPMPCGKYELFSFRLGADGKVTCWKNPENSRWLYDLSVERESAKKESLKLDVSPVQDAIAEKTFKEIEQQILNAKSISVDFGASGGKEGKTLIMSGSIELGHGNKRRLTYDWNRGNRTDHVLEVSNGIEMRSVHSVKVDSARMPARADLNRETAVSLSRLGFFPVFALTDALSAISSVPRAPNLEKSLIISDLKVEAAEDDLNVLSYRAALVLDERWIPKKEAMERWSTHLVTLYYNPKALTIEKRVVVIGEERYYERYKNWSFEDKIPDEKFKLPEERK